MPNGMLDHQTDVSSLRGEESESTETTIAVEQTDEEWNAVMDSGKWLIRRCDRVNSTSLSLPWLIFNYN